MHAAVASALSIYGMLLVQGQWELPSLADLLAGAPVTTRGYSWDYVPAWRLADDLAHDPDYADLKLWRGKRTIVHRTHWETIEALARAATPGVLEGRAGDGPREMLELITSDPGITGDQIKTQLHWEKRAFQKHKARLEELLCIWGSEQEGTAHHTHDQQWHLWRTGKIARSLGRRKRLIDTHESIQHLLIAAQLDPAGLDTRSRCRLLPVAAFVA